MENKERLRKEIEGIMGNKDSVDKILDVIEREVKNARNEGYHDCELDNSGTIGCSWDD